MLQTTLLFVLTAVAEIVGCYLPYLVLKGGRTPLLLIPAALSLALFAGCPFSIPRRQEGLLPPMEWSMSGMRWSGCGYLVWSCWNHGGSWGSWGARGDLGDL